MTINANKLNTLINTALADLSAGYGGVMISVATNWAFTAQWLVRVRSVPPKWRGEASALNATFANGLMGRWPGGIWTTTHQVKLTS